MIPELTLVTLLAFSAPSVPDQVLCAASYSSASSVSVVRRAASSAVASALAIACLPDLSPAQPISPSWLAYGPGYYAPDPTLSQPMAPAQEAPRAASYQQPPPVPGRGGARWLGDDGRP